MSDFSDGLDDIFANMDEHNREIADNADQEVQAAGIECQALTKQACPVGTPESTGIPGYIGGRLRASYQYERVSYAESKVSTNVEYAPYVELGTYKMRARPHFYPSAQTAGAHLIEALKDLGV